MHGCTGQWMENNQFSSWAVLLTNSQQVKRCTITYYWLFSWVWKSGFSPSHRLPSNMPPFMFTWLTLHSEWPSSKILQIELAKGKTPSSVLATRSSTLIWLLLMFCTKGSSVMLQYLTYKGLADVWRSGNILTMRETSGKTTTTKHINQEKKMLILLLICSDV